MERHNHVVLFAILLVTPILVSMGCSSNDDKPESTVCSYNGTSCWCPTDLDQIDEADTVADSCPAFECCAIADFKSANDVCYCLNNVAEYGYQNCEDWTEMHGGSNPQVVPSCPASR